MIFNKFLPIKFIAISSVLLGSFSCNKKDTPVSLSIELIDKGVAMTSSKAEEGVVEIYLISENETEGELLVKAMNASGLEISRAKVTLALQKDDAKLFTFNFDANLDF